jgi:hypothetical protein
MSQEEADDQRQNTRGETMRISRSSTKGRP